MNREIIVTYMKAGMINGFTVSNNNEKLTHVYHNTRGEKRIQIQNGAKVYDLNFIETITSYEFTKALTKGFIISRGLDNDEFEYYHHKLIQEQAITITKNFDDWYTNYFNLDFNL